MGKILVVNGRTYGRAVESLGKLSYDIDDFLSEPREYKLVLFTGGEDVNPELYGHNSPKGMCHYNARRDIEEKQIFDTAVKNDVALTGICRGSQFLNVMAGGKMIHHITGHAGRMHLMNTHTGDNHVPVTSTHHQMSVPSNDGFIVGWSSTKLSMVYVGNNDVSIDYSGVEVEAIYYPSIKCFAVQYHPEYMDNKSLGYKWFVSGVRDLLLLSESDFKEKYVKTLRSEGIAEIGASEVL